jgi:hypothetical protein
MLLNLHEVQRHYLLSPEEGTGSSVSRAAVAVGLIQWSASTEAV